VEWGLRHISSRELAEWQAYALVEPFGEERADWRSAVEMALLANVHRDSKRQRRPFGAQDFLLHFEQPAVDPEVEMHKQLHIVELLNMAMGGVDLRKG
jgi:hypothetical protein